MTILIHAEIHGVGGSAYELIDALREHADSLARADGSLGAQAYEPLGADIGEFALDAWWQDEDALRAHYVTPEYGLYVERIGALQARPSDVHVHYIQTSLRAVADLSMDPTRQG